MRCSFCVTPADSWSTHTHTHQDLLLLALDARHLLIQTTCLRLQLRQLLCCSSVCLARSCDVHGR
jgi:hypothetical protein